MSVKVFLTNTYDFAATNVFRELASKTGVGQHNIVLVPDKFTLSVENSLLTRLRLDCTFDVEVMSFTRFAAKTMRDKINRCLTPEGSVMLLRQATLAVRDKLEVYKNAARDTNFPREMYAVVTAMRNSGIFPHDLLSIEGGEDSARKLRDVGLIYQKYIGLLETNLSDSSTRLYAFADYISQMAELADTNIFITDFSEFTAPQYDIIDKLIACANSVTIGLIGMAKKANNGRLIPTRAIGRIKKMCAERGIVPDITAAEDVLPEWKEQILNNLYSYTVVKPVKTNGEICVRVAPDIEKEVEWIAKTVRHDVVERRMRYKDFAVVVSNAEAYRAYIKNIFKRYDIPFFFDKKLIFSNQPAAKYILSAMKCAASNFDFTEVNLLTKNPMFYGDAEGYAEVERFENHVLKYSLAKKLKKSFDDAVAEKVRKKILAVTSPFCGKPSAPALKYVEALREFAEVNRLRDKCDEIAESGQGEEARAGAQQIYGKFCAVLDEMKVTLSDEETTIADFTAMTESVFGNIKIALVPMYMDSVYVGEPEESRYDEVKYLFIAGATDGKLPKTAADTAVVGFSEEEKLIRAALEPYPTKKEKVASDCFELIQLLIKPAEQLIITYPERFNGMEVKPSAFIQQIKTLFTKSDGKPVAAEKIGDGIPETLIADRALAQSYAYKFSTLKNGFFEILGDITSKNIVPARMIPYDAMVALLPAADKERLNKLLASMRDEKEKVEGNISLDRGNFSASQMEAYFACPYKQYFQFGLRLKPREEGKLRTRETGTLSHYVMEKFVSGGYYNEFDEAKVALLINDWINERLKGNDMKFYNSGKHVNTFNRLKAECLQLCAGVARQISQSQFKPYLFEAKIGKTANGDKFNGMTVEIGRKKYYLEGSIDRVDECNGYFNIIDYKSYSKNLKLKDIYNGTKIQPLLYMSAVSDDKNLKYPSGLLYQPISVGYKSENDERFTMKGIVIDDVKVLQLMDTSLSAGGKSAYIPVTLNNDGKLAQRGSDAVPDTVLTSLALYTRKLVENAVKEIAEGNIAPSPEKDACGLCDFTAICPYEKDIRRTRGKFPKISGQDFIKLYNGETVNAKEDDNA